jgi:hypothetical protein
MRNLSATVGSGAQKGAGPVGRPLSDTGRYEFAIVNRSTAQAEVEPWLLASPL